jgi:KamA family protein
MLEPTEVSYLNALEGIKGLTTMEKGALATVAQRYRFRANSYYLGLIDWRDPHDPIRRIVLPSLEELTGWAGPDPCQEHAYTRVPGLEHKYETSAVLLVSDTCGGVCRFCFRKRLFGDGEPEVVRDIEGPLAYIRMHPEIDNVLLSGGDPLFLSSRRLDRMLTELRAIDHVKVIRIGSKMPAFNPHRILDDPDLLAVLAKHSLEERKIYLITHFDHPRELTQEALQALNLLRLSGVITANQTPILRGVNDDPNVLAELLNRLAQAGVPPYYLFVCRPTEGNRHFAVPVETALDIVEEARTLSSGLGKRARLIMSHASGKIEVLGKTEEQIFFRYHSSPAGSHPNRLLVLKRKPEALWLDDYDLDQPCATACDASEGFSVEHSAGCRAEARAGTRRRSTPRRKGDLAELTEATERIERLLESGCYRIVELREFLPHKAGVDKCWAAVVERVEGDPDDTYENVLVQLKSAAEQEWARRRIQGGGGCSAHPPETDALSLPDRS